MHKQPSSGEEDKKAADKSVGDGKDKSTKIHVGPALNISDNCTVEGDVTTSSSYNVQIFLCPKKENCNLDFF